MGFYKAQAGNLIGHTNRDTGLIKLLRVNASRRHVRDCHKPGTWARNSRPAKMAFPVRPGASHRQHWMHWAWPVMRADGNQGTPMHLMHTVCHGGQRIRDDGIVIVCVQKPLGGLLKPVDRRASPITHQSPNALDIVASSTLLVHAIGLTAPKKWFDQWWQTTGDPEETDRLD